MKILSCLLTLLICSLATVAQQNFQEGWVVLPGNDTLRGQIDFRDWDKSPVNIIFRDPRSGVTTSYLPDALRSFSVNGETYEGIKVKIYPYTFDAVAISDHKLDPTPYEKSIFVRLVTQGKISLYFYKDSLATNYFFVRKDGGHMDQLQIKGEYVEDASQPGVYSHSGAVFNYVYRDQLTALMADCDRSPQNFTRLEYKERSLKKLVFAYNNCGKDTLDLSETTKGKPRLEFAPVAGYFSTKVSYTATDQYQNPMVFPASGGFTAGVGLTIPLPRNRQKWAFYTDLLYSHFHSRSNSAAQTDLISQTGEFDFSSLKLDVLFRYRIPEGKIRPFFNAGVSNSLVLSNSSTMSTYDKVGSTTTVAPLFNDQGQGGFRKDRFGAVGGAGIRAGRFSLEARAELGETLSAIISESATTTTFFLLASFSL